MDDIRVGEVIRAVRRRSGLSQYWLAARAGSSQAEVPDFGRGPFEEVGLPLVAGLRLRLLAARSRIAVPARRATAGARFRAAAVPSVMIEAWPISRAPMSSTSPVSPGSG